MPDPLLPTGGETLLTAHQRLQNRYKYRDGGNDRRLQQLITAYYLASVSHVDAQVGRIRRRLEAAGELERTVIILTSDHGEFLGDYGCYGKRSFLDAAARVPLICRGPGFGVGRTRTPASLIDIAPTLRRAAGIDGRPGPGAPLQEIAGRPDHDRTVFGQYQQGELGLYAVIEPRWSYIWSALDRRELLLDRRHDPRQTRNAAHLVRHRSVLERLRRVAVEHFDDLRDADLDALSGTRPLRLGEPANRGGTDGYRALDLDPDASTLVVGIGDDAVGSHGEVLVDPTWQRYRDGAG